ncbi:MAG: putative DNA-invertase from lambdoid prophage Rac [Syntrophorhabdaceae bacterium PtaU1.Bin034]|nr:MAG: putative DNA-invertase from lambdoid prophage Rac [Syntrophorhabdaceae bacterium PtaU1.Bin034]
MAKVMGYIRVSANQENAENQKLAIFQYANSKHMKIDDWVESTAGSCKSAKDRKIDELLARLESGDTVIVAELSRLARSVGQIAILIDELLRKRVTVICLRENLTLNGKQDIQTEVMVTMFSLFSEVERDLIAERTKEGLNRARAEGKLLGRPKGTIGKSKLDGKEREIKEYLHKGVNRANIARIYGVTFPTIQNFIKSRNLI